MLDVRRAIFNGCAKLHRVLLKVVQHHPVCRRLMTIPGVGPVASLSFKVGVDDPLRFTGASFTSVEQLKQHINAFVKAYNENAEPFVWTKSKVHQRRVKGRRLSDL